MTIIPKARRSGWRNILRFTANPNSDRAKYGDMNPFIKFVPDSYTIHLAQSSTENANNYFDPIIDLNPNNENYVKVNKNMQGQ